MIHQHLSDTAKHAVDALSIGALIATLMDYLPGLTAVLVAIWTMMRIYESWLSIKISRRKLEE